MSSPTRSNVAVRWAVTAVVGATFVVPASGAQALRPSTRAPDPRELRDRMLALVNRSRTSHGLPRLRLDVRLSPEASRHSRQMAREDRIFHTPDLGELIADEGGHVFGENLGRGRGLRGIRDAWLREADTRRILLDPRFDRAGLGVIHVDGFYWVTLQAFG